MISSPRRSLLESLDHYFGLRAHGSSWQREIAAGGTTFVTMAYIIAVNPAILRDAGMPVAATTAATCLAAAFGCLLMGLWARYPIALAPGMGLNAYFTYSVVLGMRAPWPTALGAVFLSGVAFLALTATGLRQRIVAAIPPQLYAAVAAGIGFFISLIGFRNAGLVTGSPATLVTLGSLRSPGPLVALAGLGLTAALMAWEIPGALLMGVVASTALSVLVGHTALPTDWTAASDFSGTLLRLDVAGAWSLGALEIIFVFLFVDLFDNVGTLVAVGKRAGLFDSSHQIPRIGRVLTADAVATIDALAALARHARRARWVAPQFGTEPGLEIRGARHPVVEAQLERFIANDCVLRPGRRLLVVTGPNMGGKSTYMRSIALIALLAYAGSFVPADSARLGPIDRILTRIGAADDLARGASTFMVEMTEAAAILHRATDRSLVLMDEIGRGTSTFDGLALAAAIARALVETNRCFTLFATHYFELTQLAESLPEVANVHVAAAQARGKVVFLHEVREGPASQSYGLAVAQLAGVPPEVVRRARAVLTQLEERAAGQQPQLDLFAASNAPPVAVTIEPPEDELRQRLAAVDVDALSPREALALLYELKALLAGR